MSKINSIGVVLCAVAGSLAFASSAVAERSGQTRYGERLLYDPVQGKWLPVASPAAGTEAGELELALTELAQNKPKKARARLKKWLKRYPGSPRRPEALMALADAELALGNRMKAYRTYEKILDEYPGRESDERILRREFAIAVAFLAGVKQKFLGMRLFSAYDEALDMLDRITMRAPSATLAEEAIKAKAEYFYRTGQFELAEAEFGRLAQDFPRGRYYRYALLIAARAALARFPGLAFDDSALLEARERFITLKDQFPDLAAQEDVDAVIRRIEETMARKQLMVAQWYRKQGRQRSAAFYCEDILERWPQTAAAAEARDLLARLTGGSPNQASAGTAHSTTSKEPIP